MSAPHTPGPWDWMSVSANASGGFHLYLIDSNGRKIAALWGGAEEKAANAHLITAAPELLDTARVGLAAMERELAGFLEGACLLDKHSLEPIRNTLSPEFELEARLLEKKISGARALIAKATGAV